MKLSGKTAKSRIFFAVLFALGFFLSATFVPYAGAPVNGENTRVVADLLFALSIVSGVVCEDRRAISVMALVFGALSDFFLTPPMHLSPLLFFLGAYFSSAAVGVFTSVNAVTAAVASIPFFLMRTVSGGVFLLSSGAGAGMALKTILLPELACNVTTVFFSYLVVNFLYKRLRRFW